MSRARAPGAAQEQARRVIQHFLGSGDLRVMATVVALLVGLGWFTDSLFELLTDVGDWYGGHDVKEWWPLHRRIGIGFFLAELLGLSLLARDARRRYRPRVAIEETPAPVHGVILFLSNLKEKERIELESGLDAIDGIDGFRERFKGLNWRMPLEAIAYHRTRLQHLVAICSRTEKRTNGPEPGSAAQIALFRALVERVFPDHGFVLRDSAQLDTRYTGGIAFEDVDKVSQATDDAYADLLNRGLPNSEILIDVTGGQKPNAVAATAVALAEGRRIQYVACDRDSGECRVKVYDVTYDQ